MTAELVLFLVVAAVAIVTAAFMLVSRNAVHSALLLVTNFICVSFFYLMLHAPFLAAIQVTVYAGAIMVLFMFVIMLLGAERIGGSPSKFAWIAPTAVGLTSVLLIIAFISIVQSRVETLKPVPPAPKVGLVHAVPTAGNVDVYLNEQQIAHDLAYKHTTELEALRAGNYTLRVFPACVEAECPNSVTANATSLFSTTIKLDSASATAFVLAGVGADLRLISVPLDLTAPTDENTFRLKVVNALPATIVKVNRIDPEKPTEPITIADALAYGNVSQMETYQRGTYTFTFEQGNQRLATAREIVVRNKLHELLILTPETVLNSDQVRAVVTRMDETPIRLDEAYGSPQQIGLSMLSDFLLPFELVSLVLLAAMVGAILLTREDVIKRVRPRLVVSPTIRDINRQIAAAQAIHRTPAETTSADTSAD